MSYKVNGSTVIDENRNATLSSATLTDRVEASASAIDFVFPGLVSGYASGGAPGVGPFVNTIQKFPFASDANATDVGDLTQARYTAAGQSSSVSGYTSGGSIPPTSNVIDKFPFAADANATDVGNLTAGRYYTSGQSSAVSGYTTAGSPAADVRNVIIDKFPFAADANATDVGDLTGGGVYGAAGQSSPANGYVSGGYSPTPGVFTTAKIEKFPFASDANAAEIGNLTQARRRLTGGQSSTVSGYTAGGLASPPPTNTINTIDKFPFASDANATDVGDLTQSRQEASGQSSLASGYVSGGQTAPPSPVVNTIDKFPFASDSNATDVGDLTTNLGHSAGQQV